MQIPGIKVYIHSYSVATDGIMAGDSLALLACKRLL